MSIKASDKQKNQSQYSRFNNFINCLQKGFSLSINSMLLTMMFQKVTFTEFNVFFFILCLLPSLKIDFS